MLEMKYAALFCLWAVMLLPVGSNLARAHDLPGEVPITGFFDYTEAAPELVLRVPLIMLANTNLPKRGPGYLDLDDIEEGVARAERAAASAFRVLADGEPLSPVDIDSRISLPSDRTFDTPETAIAAILGPPLPETQSVFWNQGFFDVRLRFGPQEAGATYALRTDLPAGMAERTIITLGVLAPEEPIRTLSISGSVQEIVLDPRWYQAGILFMTKGVEHILTGYDHLLFLLCLILPLHADPRRLLGVVTAFTLGHSATLIPAALGLAPSASWFLPVVETLIAASIVYMAIENVLGAGGRLRWRLAFGFGLIHGFGFASTLTDVMQFAGAHLLSSLIFFNIGIELGQVAVLAVALPLLALLLRTASLERAGIVVISVLAGHEAWHWTTERVGGVRLELATRAEVYAIIAWIGLALVLTLIAWWAFSLFRRSTGGGAPRPTKP